ncbi:hypothetical protein ACRALDRAFT_1065798 [Sodiomyces alcalophilus JCM 7366]|uniref:uncharacterized protein n=1 Tax=Sodiomyces alcalophilus JCM 7366 TaxID=591952 RepID=UPI0039B5CEDC
MHACTPRSYSAYNQPWEASPVRQRYFIVNRGGNSGLHESCKFPNGTDTRQDLVRPAVKHLPCTLYNTTFLSDLGIQWPFYNPFVSLVRLEEKPYGPLPMEFEYSFGSVEYRYPA